VTPSEPFDLNPTPLADGLLIEINADVDVASSPVLRKKLMSLIEQETPERLAVDLTGVSFMDSSGVATLVEALRAQSTAGRRLILVGLQPRVRGILEISRLDALFTTVDDIAAAREA
jgi:anti-sigma B factor antagonist